MSDILGVIIVEDEPLAAEGLRSYIREIDFLNLQATCENALQANKVIGQYQPDLMFLDIQMPKLTGIDFLKTLKEPPLVIFTTAYPNYALQGYELDVVDYLVKPYPFDRFVKAVNKAKELWEFKRMGEGKVGSRDHLFLKTDQKFERVNFEDILWLEAMENYVRVVSLDGKLLTLMTLSNMESLLSDQFMRVHKTYIVNLDKVQAIEGGILHIGGHKIPVSRQKRKEVMDRLIR